jgi:hypothetical protein
VVAILDNQMHLDARMPAMEVVQQLLRKAKRQTFGGRDPQRTGE